MPHDRFFAENQPLLKGDNFLLEGEEFKHLTKVMRVRENEIIECFNGQGRLAQVQVGFLTKKNVFLQVLETQFEEKNSFSLILAQALTRSNHLDLIVEKGCELGMTELWLFKGERSEKDELSEQQQTRVRHLMISALKQCGSLWLPTFKLFPSIKNWQTFPFPCFYGSLEADAPLLKKKWSERAPQKGVIFVTGPEKGLSNLEFEKLKKLGAEGVSLHPHTLRTETASIIALALLSHLLCE